MDLTQDEHRRLMRALRREKTISNTRYVNHLRHCKRCQRIIRQTSQLKSAVEYLRSSHLSVELLLRYISDVRQSEHSSRPDCVDASTREVVSHLQECSLCRKRLAYYRRKIEAAEKIIAPTLIEVSPPARPLPVTASRRARIFKGTKAGVLSVFVLLAVLALINQHSIFVPYFQSPEQLRATVEYDDFEYLSGQRSSHDPAAFDANDIESLLQNAEFTRAQRQARAACTQANLSEDDLLRAHLYDLMATLKLAQRKKYFFMLCGFDTASVKPTVERCEKTLANIAADSYICKTNEYGLMCYYLAKAFFMLGSEPAATKYLRLAENVANRRRGEASELLKNLNPQQIENTSST